MSKEIIAVFQDCVLCGIKGRKKIAEYAEKGIVIRKVGFTTEEGRELCAKAVNMGIGSMPFYVSDGAFAISIDELIEKPSADEPNTQKTSSKKKKVKKNRKEENGTSTEI